MPNPSFWSALVPIAVSLGLLLAYVSFATFDFYAFSPRPNGFHLRSKNSAPLLVIAISFAAGIFAASLVEVVNSHGLIEAGANYGPKTQSQERARLVTYFLVSTHAAQVFLITVMMLASGLIMTRFHGLTGWLATLGGIVLSVGVASILTNPAAIHFGAFEVSCGLFSAGLLLTYATYVVPGAGKRENTASLIALAITSLALFSLNTNDFRYELLLVAVGSGLCFGGLILYLRKISGPHWEATSLYFITSIASVVIAGFSLFLAPKAFDVQGWMRDVSIERTRTAKLIADSTSSFESSSSSDGELVFANKIEQGRIRFQHLLKRAKRESNKTDKVSIESRPNPALMAELEQIERVLSILERLHRSHHAILEADRRTQAALRHASDPSQTDALYDFWQNQRPWMDSELLALRYMEGGDKRALLKFIQALNADVERVTQAALDVELHRIDVWIDWASQQPSSMLPQMRSVASEQVSHLESLSSATRSFEHHPDPRLYSLHRNLRRMASVAAYENW